MGVETRIVDKKVLSIQLVRGYGRPYSRNTYICQCSLEIQGRVVSNLVRILIGQDDLGSRPGHDLKRPGELYTVLVCLHECMDMADSHQFDTL